MIKENVLQTPHTVKSLRVYLFDMYYANCNMSLIEKKELAYIIFGQSNVLIVLQPLGLSFIMSCNQFCV